MTSIKGQRERAARRKYATALERARDEIRKASEAHTEWIGAAQANGTGDDVLDLKLPPAAATFNTWVGKTLGKLT